MKYGHVWTPRRVAKLRALWERDWRWTEIANELGVSVWSVKYARNQYGMPARANGRPRGRLKFPRAATEAKPFTAPQPLPPSEIPWPTPAQMMGRR